MSDTSDVRDRRASPTRSRNDGSVVGVQGARTAEKLSAFADTAEERITENIEPAKQKAMGIVQQQKVAGAEKISELAHSVHGAADSFRTELPQVSRSIHDAAATLERASMALKERSVEDLAAGVGKFARTQPVAFFGAAVVAGFAVARFIKSSAETPATPSKLA